MNPAMHGIEDLQMSVKWKKVSGQHVQKLFEGMSVPQNTKH